MTSPLKCVIAGFNCSSENRQSAQINPDKKATEKTNCYLTYLGVSFSECGGVIPGGASFDGGISESLIDETRAVIPHRSLSRRIQTVAGVVAGVVEGVVGTAAAITVVTAAAVVVVIVIVVVVREGGESGGRRDDFIHSAV